MQELSKIGIDLLFCLLIGFLIIRASNSSKQNEELNNSLSWKSVRISAKSWH